MQTQSQKQTAQTNAPIQDSNKRPKTRKVSVPWYLKVPAAIGAGVVVTGITAVISNCIAPLDANAFNAILGVITVALGAATGRLNTRPAAIENSASDDEAKLVAAEIKEDCDKLSIVAAVIGAPALLAKIGTVDLGTFFSGVVSPALLLMSFFLAFYLVALKSKTSTAERKRLAAKVNGASLAAKNTHATSQGEAALSQNG